MHRFIHEANVRHLSQLLDRTTDEEERARIAKLLAEEISADPARRAANAHASLPGDQARNTPGFPRI